MGILKSILKEMNLLMEGASVVDVNDAISNMHPAVITYKNNEGDRQARGKRKIYPIAYGISGAGNPVIRAFEYEGDTTTRVPAWKLFILPNIISWDTLSSESFKGKELKGLNKDGNDKQMVTLYNVSPLSDSARSWIKKEPGIKSVPVTKSDVNGKSEYSAEEMVDNDVNYAVSQKSVDNSVQKDYNNSEMSRMNARTETKPIEKDEIPSVAPQSGQDQTQKLYADNDPVSKDDIQGTEEAEEPEITSVYNDMMDRWDNKEE